MTSRSLFVLACVGLMTSTVFAGESGAAPIKEGAVILNEGSIWRAHFTWMKPLVRTASSLEEIRSWRRKIGSSSPLPPEDWTGMDFNDLGWMRWREQERQRLFVEDSKGPLAQGYDHNIYGLMQSPYLGLMCLRGKFTVEEPDGVRNLTLSVAYRGGIVVYVNGREVAREYLPKEGKVDLSALAQDYPREALFKPDGKPLTYRDYIRAPDLIPRMEKRVRKLEVSIPVSLLKKGMNVLALEIHRVPHLEGADTDWSTCGMVSVELRGCGAIVPNVERPRGLQVWNASVLTRVTPLGSGYRQRIGAGAPSAVVRLPLSWSDPHEALAPITIVAARKGVFSGQVVVSSNEPIRGIKATMSDLVQTKGPGRLPASAVQVLYVAFPDHPPRHIRYDPAISLLDALSETPPAQVRAFEAQHGVSTWVDGGAVEPIWVKVRVPADAPAGDYRGTLSIEAEGMNLITVPVHLQVVGWTLPDPVDFKTHMGLMQSPDTIAEYYHVPLWSERHFQLMERSYAYMRELGGKNVFLPLVAKTWLGNEQSMVYWVKQPDGSYTYDFAVFDRYLDLVQKYLKPDVVCLYAFAPKAGYMQRPYQGYVSVLDPATGEVHPMETPAWAPTPEAVAFWRPVLKAVEARLVKRGLADVTVLGLIPDGRVRKEAVELFTEVLPGVKWVQLAHYAGQKGAVHDVPYAYVMSVWGRQFGKSRLRFGAWDLDLKSDQHYRATPFMDLRPNGSIAAFRLAPERALRANSNGLAPIGMDFWVLTRGERTGTVETGAAGWNMMMSTYSTGALLAPGPEGAISTARFELLREGVEACEARMVIENALFDESTRERLGADLASRCLEAMDERDEMFAFMRCGELKTQGEGWKWYEASGWQERSEKLFSLAADVTEALARE